jgi:nitrite reductase/ring-hydroxylating ferredoxin subunit
MDWAVRGPRNMTQAEVQRGVLCRLDDLQDPGSRGVTLLQGGRLLDVFVVRRGRGVYAYINRCPHTGSPLDWNEHEFLSLDKRHIQCTMHAALFRLTDGACVAGPCVGASLAAIAVAVESGLVVLAPAAPSASVP